MTRKVKETRYQMRVDKKFKEKFLSYYRNNNFIPAMRIRALIQLDMEGKIKQ